MRRRQRNGKPQRFFIRKGPKHSQNISQHFTAPCHYYRRFTVVVHLSSFVQDSENTEPCRLYGKTVTIFLLALCKYTADCPTEVTHRRTSLTFWIATNIYSTTTDDKRRSYPETLMSKSMVSLADWPFKFPLLPLSCFLDPLVLAFGVVKLLGSASKTTSVAAEQRALLVFPARNSIRDRFAWRFVNARSIV